MGSVIGALCGGFVAGLAYFGTALHWLGSSANPDPSTFILREAVTTAGAMWLFVPWWALWWAGARVLTRLSPGLAPVAFVVAFAGSDLLLGDLVMGIPMAPLSLVALDTPLAALLPWLGQFAVDALLVAAGTVAGWGLSLVGRRRGVPMVVVAVIVVGSSWLGSTGRPEATAPAVGTRVHLAQPSLPHVALLPPEGAADIINAALLSEIERGVAAGARMVVLPEGAFLDDLTKDGGLVAEIADRLPEGTVVMTGFHRVAVDEAPDGGFSVTPYNSVMLIGSEGALAVHDKAHLVPFGETMPELFFDLGFDVIAGPSGGLGAGPAIGVLDGVAGLPPFAVLICYEGILSGAVAREAGAARWLLNVSAETLFRGTLGPRLLLEHMRLRSVETGLPMLRSTAHAFSGVILQDGSLAGVLAPEVDRGITVVVPEGTPSFFLRHGYGPLHVVLLGLAVLLMASALRVQRKRFLAPAQSNLY